MAQKNDRAAMWIAVSAPHDNERYWLNVSFRAPEPIITYDTEGNEEVSYPAWINPKLKAMLIANTVKKWLATLAWFETGEVVGSEDGSQSSIYKTQESALSNRLADKDDSFIENDHEPLVSVYCAWSKPVPHGVNTQLTYNKSPYTFTVTSSTVPGQLVVELEAMAMAHKALMKNELTDSDRKQESNRQIAEHVNNPDELYKRDDFAHAQRQSRSISDMSGDPLLLPSQIDEIISGRFNRADYEQQFGQGTSITFEVTKSEWETTDNGNTSLRFYGEGCEFPYPFKVTDKNYDYINTGKDLLPKESQKGAYGLLFVKAQIGKQFDYKGKSYHYWNVTDVWNNAYEREGGSMQPAYSDLQGLPSDQEPF